MEVETVYFNLKLQWQVQQILHGQPRRYCLYSNKLGLLVSRSDTVYFIRKRQSTWYIEWTLDRAQAGKIVKMISNFNNEIYATGELGQLLRVDSDGEKAAVIDMKSLHFTVLDYIFLKGMREESILMLLKECDILATDLLHMHVYSRIHIENAAALTAHNAGPFTAVGTTNGRLHFLSHERLRSPVVLGSLELPDATAVVRLRLFDTCCFVYEAQQRFYIVQSNFRASEFALIHALEPFSNNVEHFLMNAFLTDDQHAVLFMGFGYDAELHVRCTNEIWIYEWSKSSTKIKRTVFILSRQYRSITYTLPINKDAIQFLAIRVADNVMDEFTITNNKTLLKLNMSIETNHTSHINGLTGGRNIVTCSTDGLIIHFRTHKKSSKFYAISRYLHSCWVPRIIKRSEEYNNAKYSIIHHFHGGIQCYKLPSLTDNLIENTFLHDCEETFEPDRIETLYAFKEEKEIIVREFTPAELASQTAIRHQIQELSKKVTNLIDYDISVTNKTHGIFRKFCLNTIWLEILNEQARILFEMERDSLQQSIADQTRIREWILNLITKQTKQISTKIHAIFSNIAFENYALRQPINQIQIEYDYYRFYEMEPLENEIEDALDGAVEQKTVIEGDDEATTLVVNEKVTKLHRAYVVQGSAYDHVMLDVFAIQDNNSVTAYQMYNDNAKFKPILNDALKDEFNKKFNEIKKYKQETMDSIMNTNADLTKIYSNMNYMLGLLNMETFVPAELSVPQWLQDEVIERILTVDDSEIKAVNRRKKKQLETKHKSGRMLLWSIEFWLRALNVMMDGVLEKLWEEEIKKDIPIPEFMVKKQDIEYTLEDQKQWREYEEKVRLLTADRQKYLRILNENELKTQQLKKEHILKLNEKCAEMALMKFKYDFAIRHWRLRLLNSKIRHFKRIQIRTRITALRDENEKVMEYMDKYAKLVDYYEHSMNDMKVKIEALGTRDKTIERQFKAQYLNSIPAHLTHEINKLYKKRPKLTQKSFNSMLVCIEVANRVAQKSSRVEFPLPNDAIEFLSSLDNLDSPQNIPNQLDAKHWESFVKIRRQKIENDLKLKGYGYQMADAQHAMAIFTKNGNTMRNTKAEVNDHLDKHINDYYTLVQNQRLQITLSMGQVEISLAGVLGSLKNCILMNVDDLNEVNEMIKQAGAKKLKAMQRVAFFRRQVIFKEWEHKVIKANIAYLKYLLEVITKCKVSMEFLKILRNWQKVKEARQKVISSVIIERMIEEKLTASRKNLDRINEKLEIVKNQIRDMKHQNQQINKQIDEIKISVAFATVNRDVLAEEKYKREQNERMNKIIAHHTLLETVRRDYAHILELTTILELQRLRTYPTLGPAPPHCN